MPKQFVEHRVATSRRKSPNHSTQNVSGGRREADPRDPPGDNRQVMAGQLMDHPANDLRNDLFDGGIAVEPA